MRKVSVTFAWALAVAAAARLGAAEPPDADAKIVETRKAAFPARLREQGITHGEVRLMLAIDTQGKLTDCLVTAFTHGEFATEAVRAINEWRFVPARIGGQPVNAVARLTMLFEFSGPVAYMVLGPESSPNREARFMYEPCAARELDAPPKLVISVSPKYPPDLSGGGVKGTVFVDFFIDEAGKVRFPVARGPADWRLAALAETALKLWEFEPPRRRGRPVLTRASTSFVFEPTP